MADYFLVWDFVWILLIAVLLASAFSYTGRTRTYNYGYSSWVNFAVVLIGAILLGYFFVWLLGLVGVALVSDAVSGILGTFLGALLVFAAIWAISSASAEV